MSIADMIRHMSFSEEHIRKLVHHIHSITAKNINPNQIDFDASESQMNILLERQIDGWNLLGKTQPYFSVLTNPIFQTENLNSARMSEFYAHGQLDVDWLHEKAASFGVWPQTDGIVLEYGCGLGRLARNFCKKNVVYIGVDVSEAHLQIARQNIEESGLSNATFLNVSDYELVVQDGSIDFLVSLLVFQHTPPPLMMRQIEIFLKKLRPGGGAYLQVPTCIFGYSFNIDVYLGNPPPVGQIEMHATTQEQVFTVIRKCGHTLVEVVNDGRIGDMGISSGFVIRGGV